MANVTPENCIANGTITVTLPSFQALDGVDGKPKPVTSSIEKIGGLSWRMEVQKVANDVNKPAKFKVFIYCNEEVKDHLWLCKVHFTFTLIIRHSATGTSIDQINTGKHYYGFNSHYWILPIEHSYINQISAELQLNIRICNVHQQSFPPLDTSLVVNMGENKAETLLMNKNALAILSNYFRNLFFEDWRDKNEQDGTTFELNETEDFDIRAFKAMIYSAMTMGWMVQESNMLDYELAIEIVKLAIKFDVPMLFDHCEKFLVSVKDKDHSKMDLLKLADDHSITGLKEHCLETMDVQDFMREFSKNLQILLSLGEATREQLQTKFDGKAKEQSNPTTMEESRCKYDPRRRF